MTIKIHDLNRKLLSIHFWCSEKDAVCNVLNDMVSVTIMSFIGPSSNHVDISIAPKDVKELEKRLKAKVKSIIL